MANEVTPRKRATATVVVNQEAALESYLATRDNEIALATELAIRARHADNTVAGYDYWLGRFLAYWADPSSRWRNRNMPAFSGEEIFPILGTSTGGDNGRPSLGEVLLNDWLIDMALGPVDEEELEDWDGPWSPGTLNNVIAAIRARTVDFQEAEWVPSTWFQTAKTGLARKLREVYGASKQATPLTSKHVALIAEHLYGSEPEMLTLDRLIFEMYASGISTAEIARCKMSSVVSAGSYDVEMSDPETGTRWIEQGMFGRRLVIPGRFRRGGNQDAPTIYDLDGDANKHLSMSLDRWLKVRPQNRGDDLFAAKGTKNLPARVKQSLTRTAELAESTWQPGEKLTNNHVALMRSALNSGTDWGGSLTRQRNLVMLLVGYLCALRRSELLSLTLGDVEISDGKAVINIAKSKTDQDAKGFRLSVPDAAGNSSPELQAATLLAQWVDTMRQFTDAADAPLFPSFDRHGAFFISDGERLPSAFSDQQWSKKLKELALATKCFGDPTQNKRLYELVRGHSLRRGLVTQAILDGHDSVAIAKRTRHKNVNMIATYADKLLAESTDFTEAMFGRPSKNQLELPEFA